MLVHIQALVKRTRSVGLGERGRHGSPKVMVGYGTENQNREQAYMQNIDFRMHLMELTYWFGSGRYID